MHKYTEDEIAAARELLSAHEQATEAGIAYSTDQKHIEAAGWDHFPPTSSEVARAKRIVTRSAFERSVDSATVAEFEKEGK